MQFYLENYPIGSPLTFIENEDLCRMTVIVVRIDCSHQMLRDEVISLTYSSPLRVNVPGYAYFAQVQDQLVLERVHRVFKCNFCRQIVPWCRDSVERKACSRLIRSR